MMKFMRENHSENALARPPTTTSLSPTFSSTFFPFTQTSMMAARSSRIFPLPTMNPTHSYDFFSSTSAIDDYYNDIGSILDFPIHAASSSRAYSIAMDETIESTTLFGSPIKSEPSRYPSRRWSSIIKANDHVQPSPLTVQSSPEEPLKPPPQKRRRRRTTTTKSLPPAKRRRIAKTAPMEEPSTPKTTNRQKVVKPVPEKAPSQPASIKSQVSLSVLSEEKLDPWQKQFLNFLTYPSDHIEEATGQLVPFRETIIWGRQKVLWTAPLGDSETDHPTESSSSTSSGKSKSTWVNLSSKSGGNHLSNQLVVRAAAAAASSSAPEKKGATNFIRRTTEQSLWFHGDDKINQNLGLWLQEQRRSYRATAGEKSSHPLLKRINEKIPSRGKTMPLNSNKRPKRHRRSKDAAFTENENEIMYAHMQKTFRFQLLQLCGIDMQNILPEDTLFPRTQTYHNAK